ncbi:MAG: hypothetical protein DELT_02656 [Desulfovibrio sp.]
MKFCPDFLTTLRVYGFSASGERSVHPCCGESSVDYPHFFYEGETFDLSEYKLFLHNTLRTLQGGTTLCKGCPKLVDVECDIEHVDLNLSFFDISLGLNMGFCNLQCIYCGQDISMKGHSGLPVLPLLRYIENNRLIAQGGLITWSGGEPTLHPEFTAPCDLVRQWGYHQRFLTNALRFSPQIASVLEENTGDIVLSLDCGTEATYTSVKGINAFPVVMRNIISYRRISCEDSIALKYIFVEINANKKEVDAFFDLCLDVGINWVSYSCDGYGFRFNSSLIEENIVDSIIYFIQKTESLEFRCTSQWIPPVIKNKIALRRYAINKKTIRQHKGRFVILWGGGAALEAYKDLLAELRVSALLVTLPANAETQPSKYPVMHPDDFFTDDAKYPFFVFCRAMNQQLFFKTIAPYRNHLDGKIIWCTL